MTPAKDQVVKQVHLSAKPVERFDQVIRYMVRHEGKAKFGYIGEVRHLADMKLSKLARRVARDLFNDARKQGFNQ